MATQHPQERHLLCITEFSPQFIVRADCLPYLTDLENRNGSRLQRGPNNETTTTTDFANGQLCGVCSVRHLQAHGKVEAIHKSEDKLESVEGFDDFGLGAPTGQWSAAFLRLVIHECRPQKTHLPGPEVHLIHMKTDVLNRGLSIVDLHREI